MIVRELTGKVAIELLQKCLIEADLANYAEDAATLLTYLPLAICEVENALSIAEVCISLASSGFVVA